MRSQICRGKLPNTTHTMVHKPKPLLSTISVTCHQHQRRLSRCPSTQCPYKRRLTSHLNFFPQTISLSATNTFHPTSMACTNTLMGWSGGKKRSSQKTIGPLCQVKECRAPTGLLDRSTFDLIGDSPSCHTIIIPVSDLNNAIHDASCIAKYLGFSTLSNTFTTYLFLLPFPNSRYNDPPADTTLTSMLNKSSRYPTLVFYLHDFLYLERTSQSWHYMAPYLPPVQPSFTGLLGVTGTGKKAVGHHRKSSLRRTRCYLFSNLSCR